MRPAACRLVFTLLVSASGFATAADPAGLIFACRADNDLYAVFRSTTGREAPRFDSPATAIAKAPTGAGVLLLADDYPAKPTALDAAMFKTAAAKNLRLYVEYPGFLPGLEVKPPRRTALERAVVAADVFAPALEPMHLLAIHDCHFVEVAAPNPLLVVAKVAGFDKAVYGLEGTPAHPLLFEHAPGRVLVSTTKLSQFVTARYATQAAMQALWQHVFRWLAPDHAPPHLRWTPAVRPSFARDEKLPDDAARRAVQRGVDWYTNARMLLGPEGRKLYDQWRTTGQINAAEFTGPLPPESVPVGDGRHGVLEGINSRIGHDGTQPVRWWLRSDCNGESTAAFALRWKLDGDKRSREVAANLLDWVYFNSGLFQTDPGKANCGLLYWAPDNQQALYQDNDIKAILGGIATAGVFDSDRWDESLARNILGNFRTTGCLGFRNWRLENPELLARGWQEYWRSPTVQLQPHYQAWMWAGYLWLHDKTRHEPLLTQTRHAIGMMMDAYPDQWRWTNGIQQERARMLLPLAWLIRVDDKPVHRAWLKRIATDIERCQEPGGAILEELGPLANGDMRPPASNAEYGAGEAPLIQQNGDPVADLLYTCNFAFLGLHEAHAATGDEQYRRMADRLADFLVRIQVRSETHPELDGGWFRAFDSQQWDYWGSNADSGWGAWAIEVGWTQGWIPTVLALRELRQNLWQLSANSRIGQRFETIRREMIGDEAPVRITPSSVAHAAQGKHVQLAPQANPPYTAAGAASLTDGELGAPHHQGKEWLGFLGADVEAAVDLTESTRVRKLAVHYLSSSKVGILPPKEVEFAVSADGKEFTTVGKVTPEQPAGHAPPRCSAAVIEVPPTAARHLRVRVKNPGALPGWIAPPTTPSWLFLDEVLVNPAQGLGTP